MKYDKLKQVIREAVPGIGERLLGGEFFQRDNTIRLADVLIALHPNTLIDGLGWFWEFVDGWEYKTKQTKIQWNLKENFDNQSDECKDFLSEL